MSSDQKNVQEANADAQKIKGRENAVVDGPGADRKHSKDIVYLFDNLIQHLEYQVEQDLRQEGRDYKGKKKRERWQRR